MIDATFFRGLWWQTIPPADRGPVTYRRQTSPDVFTDRIVPQAWFRQGKLVEAEVSNAGYLTERLDWFLPREYVTLEPSPGDQVRVTVPQKDGYPITSKTFVVGPDGAKAVNAEGVWKLSTVRPHVNPARAEIVNVYRPQPLVTSVGFIEEGNATLLAGPLTAAIQVSDTFAVAPVQAEEVFGRFQAQNPVRVYLDVVIRVQPNDWVQRADGTRLTILNDSNINRVGEFMALDCIQSQ